jgi:hypothetical protein
MLLSFIKDTFKRQVGQDNDELERARLFCQASQLNSARETLDSLLKRSPNSADALLLRGVVNRLLGNPQGAIADLVQAQRLQANHGDCSFEMALCWEMLGDTNQAAAHCAEARRSEPSSGAAFSMLAQLRLPGEYYFDVLARIFAHLRPTTYVEIGVFEGASLRLARSASAIVGIDPDPKITWALEPNMKVFKTTSDEFFSTYDLTTELGGRPVDLAFVDGMHQFEFAMRDFANLEQHCQNHSVVLVHDCYPLDEESAGREPRASNWSGDVWRLIVLLKKFRPDLLIHTIGTAPTGLAVIQNLDPKSTFLMENQARLYEEFAALDYSYLDEDKHTKLNLFPNEWIAIEKMIRVRTA